MRVVIVASGEPMAADAAWLDGADLVVAADGGGAWLDRLGRRPDLLVGDLDSIDGSLVERLAGAGTEVERHPTDKEASDTELALLAARSRGATEIVLVGALAGNRLDHELANLLLLADPDLADVPVTAVRGGTTVRVLRPGAPLDLQAEAGDLVTLLPLGGDAGGVTTDGLRWPLTDATLRVGRSRGLSNEVVALPASVSLADGLLLVIRTSSHGAHA
ncbi:MAG TPA: thiamine diphosphokinase [Candidatus Limnocylindria bacterium]|nr:thiamine diphosphokinase [Candidatus Limnocylindria bacterium]